MNTKGKFTTESRIVNTTAWGCRSTASRRWFVVGPFDTNDSYHRGIAQVAYRSKAAAQVIADRFNKNNR